jgi:phosphoglycerate dehydrogenase-like enzyme
LDVWAWVTDPHVPVVEIANMPKLEVIVTASTGTNHIPVKECTERGIKVLSLLDDRAGLNTIRASSEATFMLLLMVLRNAKQALYEVQNGRWQQHERTFRGNELNGKKVGIIGFGRIGSNMFKWCSAFGAIVWRIYDPHKIYGTKIEEVFSECDVVIVSCTLSEETENMITGELLALMPEGGVLINTSRGEILSEDIVSTLLRRTDIRLGIDTLRGEVDGSHLRDPLLSLNNVTVLPHMAGITVESQTKAAQIACGLLRSLHN